MGLDANLLKKGNYLSFEDKENIKTAITGKKSEYLGDAWEPKDFKCPKPLKDTLSKLQSLWQYDEDVAYFRKANMLHGWFVNHCKSIDSDIQIEVSYKDLVNLLSDIQQVMESIVLVDGKVLDCREYKDGEFVDHYRNGKIIKDPSVAEKLLPITTGFFFGLYGYDENYVSILDSARAKIQEVVNNSNEDDSFEYVASY